MTKFLSKKAGGHAEFNVDRLLSPEQLVPRLINNELTAPIDPIQARMAFRREYYNYSYLFNHKGCFIDLSGNVYKYEYKLASGNQSAENSISKIRQR